MKKQKDYALVDIVLRLVIEKDNRLKLHEQAPAKFTQALDALFAHPTLDPKEEIEALVRLGLLFEREHAYELTDEIIDLLANDDRALSMLGINSAKKVRETKNQFAQLVGGAKPKLAAPVFGAAAPKGSMKVSSFLDVGRELRACPPGARAKRIA